MSNALYKDNDWAPIEGRFCQVKRFTPFANLTNGKVVSTNSTMPYAFVELECIENGAQFHPNTVGAISHKLDFQHLWAAFTERGVGDDEQVFIVWSKRNLRPAARLISPFMPRLAVMIFKTEAFKMLTDAGFRPEFGGRERFMAELPIHLWQPKVWMQRILPTALEKYTSHYLMTGDESYLCLIQEYK